MSPEAALLVFDDSLSSEGLADCLASQRFGSLDLFPVTSRRSVIGDVRQLLAEKGYKEPVIHKTAHLVDEQVGFLRDHIPRWSADMGQARFRGKTITEWLLIPGTGVSGWWFSLLSEKTPLKSDAFVKIAQTRAVGETVSKGAYGALLLSCRDRRQEEAIVNGAKEYGVRCVRVRGRKRERTKGLRLLMPETGVMGRLLRGFSLIARYLSRRRSAKKSLGPLAAHRDQASPLLFITYFPYVDEDQARNGVFRDKYFLPLQEKLKEAGIPVTWAGIYVPMERASFDESVRLAARFTENGEQFYLCEEFLTVRDVLLALCLWLRQTLLCWVIFRFADAGRLLPPPFGRTYRPLVRSLWEVSFYGQTGIQAILFYFMFRRLFALLSPVATCVYLCEMYAWERALEAARRDSGRKIRTIAYQHASVPVNLFTYFTDPLETARTGRPTDLPLPDVVACNGKITEELLVPARYPSLVLLEAIRYLYLNQVLAKPLQGRPQKPVLLVAGSVDPLESTRLIELVHEACQGGHAFEVWFKPHPYLPFDGLFRELGIDTGMAGYRLVEGDISRYLDQAAAVLVPTSTVAIEALAYGCDVIVPSFVESINMNPLVTFGRYYHPVTDAGELRTVMTKVLRGERLVSPEEGRSFVTGHWELDEGLTRWMSVLRQEGARS